MIQIMENQATFAELLYRRMQLGTVLFGRKSAKRDGPADVQKRLVEKQVFLLYNLNEKGQTFFIHFA